MNDRQVVHLQRIARARDLVASGRLTAIRERSRLSKAEVARAVGVDPATVSRWEAGTRQPGEAQALKLLDVLDGLAAFS